EFHQLPVVQKRARAVRLESIQFPEARALIDILHSHRIDIALYEITNRFNFPSYTCTIADENPFRKLGHYTGAGTHSFKGIAVCRALTEAVQSRLTYIAGSRDDMFPQDYTLSWSKLSVPGVLDFDSMPSRPYGHIDEQLEDILSMLSSYGLDVLYHRHTQADEPITVLKCVVPGIQI
ncbi:MAG: hypothetical protein EBX40_08880, partial [Gammaproteobacteria bacterium]|nr:hypothetical protein [Gammaproteobacteria bacterium]